MSKELAAVIKHWSHISAIATYPKNKKEYERMQNFLDELLEEVGSNENHVLIGLVDLVSYLIATYEEAQSHHELGSSRDALKYLMEAHHLRQADLSDLGSQGVISEILSGKRPLSLRQIILLSRRFHVSPATFIDVKSKSA